MDFKDTPFWKWWREYGKHLEAVAIIILLITVWYAYSDNSKLQKEISLSCGWGEENYQCFCQKDEALAIKDKIDNPPHLTYEFDTSFFDNYSNDNVDK